MIAVGWQRAEGALVALAAGLSLWLVGAQWGAQWPVWLWPVLFLLPDLSFAAYAAGPRAGALGYNLVHTYAPGALLAAAGVWQSAPLAAALGLLWVFHVGFDRAAGYGLKGPQGFNDTHLGRIGRG